MGCINDSPVFLFSIIAACNLALFLFVQLNPRSWLPSLALSVNLGTLGLALLAANLPHVGFDDIASALPILVGLSVVFQSVLYVAASLGFVFLLVGIFGSAALVNKQQVEQGVQAVLYVDIGNVGYYILIAAILLTLITIYYYTTKSVLLAYGSQCAIFSFTATAAIFWFMRAATHHFTVCFDSPQWGWWPWIGLWIGLTVVRCLHLYYYLRRERQKTIQQFMQEQLQRTKKPRFLSGYELIA